MTLRKQFASAMSGLGHMLAHPIQSLCDIWTAVREPRAMPAKQRHLDEFKIGTGGAVLAASAVEGNVLGVAGGLATCAEALIELETAGHKWNAKHHHHAAHLHR